MYAVQCAQVPSHRSPLNISTNMFASHESLARNTWTLISGVVKDRLTHTLNYDPPLAVLDAAMMIVSELDSVTGYF